MSEIRASGTIFSLKPLNQRALDVVWSAPAHFHPVRNRGIPHLDIRAPYGLPAGDMATVLIIGSTEGERDLSIEGDDIVTPHCTFSVNQRTGVLLVEDETGGWTTLRPHRQQQYESPLSAERPRAVIMGGVNPFLFVGEPGKEAKFQIEVHLSPEHILRIMEHRRTEISKDDRDKYPPVSFPGQTPFPAGGLMRHQPVSELGRGAFGKVMKTVDLYSGDYVAVKIILPTSNPRYLKTWQENVKLAQVREVGNLARISHPNIVEYLGSQGWDTPTVQIFMPMMRGGLESLAERYRTPLYPNLIEERVLRPATLQILSALDYLAFHGFIHRDIKGENILYDLGAEDNYIFRLADFGLSQEVSEAPIDAGTTLYIPPEIYNDGHQTPKIDMWALFVTFLYLRDADFRRFADTPDVGDHQKLHGRIMSLAMEGNNNMSTLSCMAIYHPELRYSAAQMLLGIFEMPALLTTPVDQIPPHDPNHFTNWSQSIFLDTAEDAAYLQEILGV
ncbi:hypothetical protein AAE478_010127 [Parahypoxylon ruwenzoriense]